MVQDFLILQGEEISPNLVTLIATQYRAIPTR